MNQSIQPFFKFWENLVKPQNIGPKNVRLVHIIVVSLYFLWLHCSCIIVFLIVVVYLYVTQYWCICISHCTCVFVFPPATQQWCPVPSVLPVTLMVLHPDLQNAKESDKHQNIYTLITLANSIQNYPNTFKPTRIHIGCFSPKSNVKNYVNS